MTPTLPELLHCLQGRVGPVIAIADQTASVPPVLMNRPSPGAGCNASYILERLLNPDLDLTLPQSTEGV
jgi:hypothetical protein